MANGQRITLKEQNASLSQILNKIEKQTGYTFFYNKKAINLEALKALNIEVHNESLSKALDALFEGKPYGYEIQDKIIVLTKKTPNKEMVESIPVMRDYKEEKTQQTLRGTVKDSLGTPLESVTVTVKGTALATTTDRNGNYQIALPTDTHVLLFSLLGFKSVEISAAGSTILDIVLRPAYGNLDEVVVIGYGTMKKKDLTGAIDGVKEEVFQQTKSSSFINSLQGRISGVQITTGSGEPGTGSRVLIRGANSLTGNSDPLYVIDGIQINESDASVASSRFGRSATRSPLSTINPADIVSIDVLKDASATAIYGSRGANGVIIVTTRQGKEGAPIISYDGNWGQSFRANKIEMLNGDEWIDYRKDWTLMPDGKRYAYGYFTDPFFFANPEERDPSKLEPIDVYGLPQYDWQDEMYRTAISTMHGLTVTGGSTYTKYAASLGYNSEEGMLLNNNYQRYNARLKLDHAKDRIGVSLGLNSTYSIYRGAAQSGDGYNNMGILQTALISRPVVFNNPLAVQTQGGWKEPTANLKYVDRKTTLPNTSGNATLSYKIMSGL
ncbi:MAG TPA: SusC/RagA family TonB-linked outer membrane protein, partial [Sphingobacterium sp.]|nr:SusC/RagA family TonB-linked outer membrane protein [Sphingobacterium sp.]